MLRSTRHEPVSHGIRRTGYMNTIAPQDMRQHMMLNQSRLSTAEEVAQAIEDYWDATEEFSRDDMGQAGFIAPVGKGPAIGGKPNGVPYNFGKSSGTEGKGIMLKGLGFTRAVNSECLVDTALGVGETAIKKPSVGLNKST